MKLAKLHFPNESYLILVSKTEEVFERKNAPKLRLNKRSIDLALSIIDVDAKNIGRQTLNKISHAIDERLLPESQSHEFTINRVLSIISHFLVMPAIKWIFTIIGLVIVASITYRMGFGG